MVSSVEVSIPPRNLLNNFSRTGPLILWGFTSNKPNKFQESTTYYTLRIRIPDVRIELTPFSNDGRKKKLCFELISSLRKYIKCIWRLKDTVNAYFCCRHAFF